MALYDFAAPRLHVDTALSTGTSIVLDRTQQNYLCNVLRLNEGETVLVFNGCDGEWRSVLTQGPSRKAVALKVGERLRPQTPGGDLHYLFAPLKHQRLDYMVQKAVEMGASVLRPVLTHRTQAARVNLDRMRANVVEAAEQCGILSLPEVHPVTSLADALITWPSDRALVFCDEEAAGIEGAISLGRAPWPSGKLAVLIGPEGGFDPGEREALLAVPSVVRLSLGPRILRADTAAVAALTLVQAILGDWPRLDPS